MTIKLSDEERIRILNSDDLFEIMRKVLLREEKIDQDREHFWVIGLSNSNNILFVELISMGTVNSTLVEPMEVYSVALQKRAVKVMLVHNHPSGNLEPSENDKILTDRLIQVGLIIHVPVLDHLIISPIDYVSFSDIGLLAELQKSLRFVPRYKQIEQLKKLAEEAGRLEGKIEGLKQGLVKGKEEGIKEGSVARSIQIARLLKEKNMSDEEIAEITGLPLEEVKKLG
ncbi:JAB domain-containing protein [Chryseolinea lacunae]|uniref:DNA repair protein n=1 Tax=Chryseolinea lacunae TaxID=2801331 RepID=A0ABS1KWJ1_9BACT|nr:JAB domain-containing protein [Chryseolinea lacunae]MBL0743834.1 DNA repair protein [Chryseolinea lacunae]